MRGKIRLIFCFSLIIFLSFAFIAISQGYNHQQQENKQLVPIGVYPPKKNATPLILLLKPNKANELDRKYGIKDKKNGMNYVTVKSWNEFYELASASAKNISTELRKLKNRVDKLEDCVAKKHPECNIK